MSKRQKIQIWGLILVSAGGWILVGSLIASMNWSDRHYETVNGALTKSLIERSNLSEELERMRNQLKVTEQELATLRYQISGSSSKLAGLPDHVRQKLRAGAVAKYMTIQRAKLRSGPSTQSQELAILSPKTPIEVVGLASDGQWLKVVRVGYVHNDLLRPLQ